MAKRARARPKQSKAKQSTVTVLSHIPHAYLPNIEQSSTYVYVCHQPSCHAMPCQPQPHMSRLCAVQTKREMREREEEECRQDPPSPFLLNFTCHVIDTAIRHTHTHTHTHTFLTFYILEGEGDGILMETMYLWLLLRLGMYIPRGRVPGILFHRVGGM